MTTLSDPTIGLLTEIAVDGLTADQLETLLVRADLKQDRFRGFDRGGSSKHGQVRPWLRGARVHAEQGDTEAPRALLTFTRRLVELTVLDPVEPPRWFGDLQEALLGDGYQLAWDREQEQTDMWADFPGKVTVTYRILPTDSGPVPLAGEISALERDLGSRGYTTAVTHFRQAVSNFGQHQYEAANGALRTTLEAVVIGLAKDKARYVGHGNAGEGGAAISHIVTTGALPERDGGKMLWGLWNMIQTNGPHPGQSTADEARMRMQLVAATARFLLNHFPA